MMSSVKRIKTTKLVRTKPSKVKSRLSKLVARTTEVERIVMCDGFKYFVLDETS